MIASMLYVHTKMFRNPNKTYRIHIKTKQKYDVMRHHCMKVYRMVSSRVIRMENQILYIEFFRVDTVCFDGICVRETI